jgi:hypothetical protein
VIARIIAIEIVFELGLAWGWMNQPDRIIQLELYSIRKKLTMARIPKTTIIPMPSVICPLYI